MYEVVISTESVNCYGARVLTEGIDTSQYERNPVLLYMHQRFGRENMPIGRVEGLCKKEGKLTGTLVFDENDPEAGRIADKWKNNFLRMVSPSLEVVATSEEPEMLSVGQIRPTVTKCKLREVSVVDIGGNDDALPLQFEHGGRVLELSATSPCSVLPLLKTDKPAAGNDEKTKFQNLKIERMKQILLALGLAENATDAEALASIATLKAKADAAERVELAAITAAVHAARDAGKFTADKEAHFVSLGKTAGLEALNETLALMRPTQKPTDVIGRGTEPSGGKVELKWGDLTPESAEKIKAEKPDEYLRLYKAEFGCEPA